MFFLGLSLGCNHFDLNLPSSWDYMCEAVYLACQFFKFRGFHLKKFILPAIFVKLGHVARLNWYIQKPIPLLLLYEM
jgi:hypothetical protein